ncbi:hypothetical protein F7725_007157 [Dissostichus mawsoni]|uniref:Uncharacterized protein n=1 Tax=Dissostichus mawsoni TaxID=36200 RepID=A0A7J5XW11_DISMA|nr:hypothetical protein F7725_007157 [Dissostichus mawsoni]
MSGGRCHREQGYLVQGGSLPVSFASLQYLSFRMNAAALGCLCLVKTPFLLPTTRSAKFQMSSPITYCFLFWSNTSWQLCRTTFWYSSVNIMGGS